MSGSDMFLRVECRDCQDIVVKCGYGSQTFKWLGNTVKFRYAQDHPQFSPEQFLPIQISKDHSPLFPHELISDRCKSGDRVKVELLGPRIGPQDPNYTREQTLWELYAFTPTHNFVTVSFCFDSSEHEPLEEAPGIFGNFNGWGVPAPMSRVDENSWEYTTEFPAGAEVVFMFHIGGNPVLSDKYEVVADPHGSKLNYLQVSEPYTNYGELKMNYPDAKEYFLKAPALPDAVPRVLTSRVVGMGKFEGVKEFTDEMKNNQFEADWQRFGMEESISEPVVREKLRAMLLKHYSEICEIFRMYSTCGAKDIHYMNVMKFCTFLYTCKFPDPSDPKKLPITKFDELYHMVAAKEEWSEDVNVASSNSSVSVAEDPLAPSCVFLRPQFMQALVRIAQLKYRAIGPDSAIDRLFKEFLCPPKGPVALEPDKNDIRWKYCSNNTQKVFELYRSRLYKLYLLYSSRIKGSDQIVPSITVANLDKMAQELTLVPEGTQLKKICFNLINNEGKEPVAIPPPADTYEMAYSEFLEGLVRLAVHNFPKELLAQKGEPEVALHVMVEMLFSKMFPTPTNKRSRKVRTAFIGFKP